MKKKTTTYAVLNAQYCGDVSVPGKFIVVTMDDKFMTRISESRNVLKQYKFTEIEFGDMPTYAFINDIEWLTEIARIQLSIAGCVLVRTEPTVFFDLSEDMDDYIPMDRRCVNIIPKGFQIVERMEDNGEEVFATCTYPDDMTVYDV